MPRLRSALPGGRPTHVIAHLSDTHMRPRADPLVGGVVDAEARLRRAVGVLSGWDQPCDAWFFGGDLSDTGDAETYELLRAIVEPAARRLGVRAIYANGNHDDPDALARVLLGEPGASGPLDRAYDLRGLRLLTVDSCVPGVPYGRVAEAVASPIVV